MTTTTRSAEVINGGKRQLSSWNQAAMRSYVRQVFCFPFCGASQGLESLRLHLASALAMATVRFPDYAARVFLEPGSAGKVSVGGTCADKVSLRVFDQRSLFGWTYQQLRAAGFPAKAFVDPSFTVPYKLVEGGPGIPVLEVHARVIEGGLLLCIYLHHSVSDGVGMTNFLSTFAACTRLLPECAPQQGIHSHGYPTDIYKDLPDAVTLSLVTKMSFEELMSRCPEYGVLTNLSGPTAPLVQNPLVLMKAIPKIGRIFKFSFGKIDSIKRAARQWRSTQGIPADSRYPSTYACLAALTWAFSTVSRFGAPDKVKMLQMKKLDRAKDSTGVTCRMLMPASWARRVFQDASRHYAGNAVAMPEANAVLRTLFDVKRCPVNGNVPTTGRALGALVHCIETALSGIDDDFVATRTAMFRAAPDPRAIGVRLDATDARDFIFNSWRRFGADTAWGIPGVGAGSMHAKAAAGGGLHPDAVRRAQETWNMGAGVIMPGTKDSGVYEVLVTLDVPSMERLCCDENWTAWVDEVVE
ncbi:C-8 acyltransferase [Purpureocillium lavendulum]|uniref:C-8 acyltransferase n=1 Tax=Purpureocillium lavendulum TaxID=1247861 RepID=A0AB34G4K4_9HYPO|nr:C-8 acyltransferase [Purpureocillium lavendulum]